MIHHTIKGRDVKRIIAEQRERFAGSLPDLFKSLSNLFGECHGV
jgi:hypothetical protein